VTLTCEAGRHPATALALLLSPILRCRACKREARAAKDREEADRFDHETAILEGRDDYGALPVSHRGQRR
jgi:hypothetical protein